MKTHHRRGLTFRRKRNTVDLRATKTVLLWVLRIALVLVLAFLTARTFFSSVHMTGVAMESTLLDNDAVFVSRIGKIEQGDVIAFLPKGNTRSHYYIRRVVGAPGDTVLIEGGELYVNGKVYDILSKDKKIADAGNAQDKITLGEGEYFVLGDNYNESEDSRYSNIGIVQKDDIFGKVWVCFSPLSDFNFIN